MPASCFAGGCCAANDVRAATLRHNSRTVEVCFIMPSSLDIFAESQTPREVQKKDLRILSPK
jgi:hypothetical protein